MDALRDRYYPLLAVALVLVLASSVISYAFLPHTPMTRVDTSFYQHAGWYITQGAVPYVQIWDVKPPLHFEMQTVLALFSGGDMTLLHVLNILLSCLAVAGTVYSSAELVRELTGDRLAALTAGLMILSFPFLYIYASMGFRNKLHVLFAGSFSVLLQWKKRPFRSGVFSTLALGFWQFGIVFPVMTLVMGFERQNYRALRRTVLGILLTGLLILLPVFYWGAFEAMVVEAIAVPLIMEEPLSVSYRIMKLTLWSDYAIITMVLGLWGAILFLISNQLKHTIWFGAGFVLTLIQVFVIDLDSHADAFLLMYFIGVGMGYFTYWVTPKKIPYILSLVVVTFSINWATHINRLGYQYVVPHKIKHSFQSLFKQPRSGHSDFSSMTFAREWNRDDFWNKRRPETCHYRLSTDEKEWIKRTDQSPFHKHCGRWEYLVRYLNRSTPTTR